MALMDKMGKPRRKSGQANKPHAASQERPSVTPEVAADAMPPFQVFIAPRHVANKSRKRKRDQSDVNWQYQAHDFDPNLSVNWAIKPSGKWMNLKMYQKFIVGDKTLRVGDIVYIHNREAEDTDQPGLFDTSHQWFAQVLEVRAEDEFHVYLRVFWLYRHADLPIDIQASHPYHGEHELIPSNSMEVVDAMSVNGQVLELKRFNDFDDEATEDNAWYQDVFWRQTYDIRTQKLSEIRRYCICKQPTNPDSILVRCSNEGCEKWLHAKCIEDDVTERTQCQLRRDGAEPVEDSDTIPNDSNRTEMNGDTVTKKVSGVFSKFKSKFKSSEKGMAAPVADVKPTVVTGVDGPVAIEATVFKKKNDGLRQSYCMVKVTKRKIETGEEDESEEEIECLFCRKKVE